MHISCDFNVSPLALPALGEHPVERERARERESERARERERERERERGRETACATTLPSHWTGGRSDCRDALIGLRNKPPLSPASRPVSRLHSRCPAPPRPRGLLPPLPPPPPTPPPPPAPSDAPYPRRVLNDGYYFAGCLPLPLPRRLLEDGGLRGDERSGAPLPS